jgi:hypothetical protein
MFRHHQHHHHHHGEHGRFRHAARHIVFGVLIAVALVLVFGSVFMLLWNALLPELFAVHPVTYWQSVGLLLLARILTGGLGHGRGGRGHFGRGPGMPPWKEYDAWWQEVGEKSFSQHARNGKTEPGPAE